MNVNERTLFNILKDDKKLFKEYFKEVLDEYTLTKLKEIMHIYKDIHRDHMLIAYIERDLGYDSGFLLSDGYITNDNVEHIVTLFALYTKESGGIFKTIVEIFGQEVFTEYNISIMCRKGRYNYLKYYDDFKKIAIKCAKDKMKNNYIKFDDMFFFSDIFTMEELFILAIRYQNEDVLKHVQVNVDKCKIRDWINNNQLLIEKVRSDIGIKSEFLYMLSFKNRIKDFIDWILHS